MIYSNMDGHKIQKKMVCNMINALFDKGTMKKFDDLAKKQAKLDEKKNNLVKKTMVDIDSDTLKNVLNTAKEYGHPEERKLSEEIENKYISGEKLGFDDLMNLDSLYKSNYRNFSNKDVENE